MNANTRAAERRMIPMQYDSKTDGIRTDIGKILLKIENYIIVFSPDRVKGKSLSNKLFLIVNTELSVNVLETAEPVLTIVINKLNEHSKNKNVKAIKQILDRLSILAALLFETNSQSLDMIKELINLRDFCERTEPLLAK